MLTGKKALLFDMDGTLMDSMYLWSEIDLEYLGRYGQKPYPEMKKEIEGMSFTETACFFKERFAIADSVEEIKEEWNRMAYRKYACEVQMKPGAGAFLQRMRAKGMRMAIASSNSRRLIEACLTHNQISGCFDSIVTACEVSKGKPSPDIYLQAARNLEVSAEECLVFEDVPMGILAGKNAGMQVCAVADAFSADREEEIRALADYYIYSYDEIRG